MRKFVWLVVLLSGVITQGFSQTLFVSQPTGGAWNLGITWDQTGCTTGCVAGVDYPGTNDVAIIAVTGTSFVSFPRSGSPSFAVKDVFIVYNVANSVRTTGLSGLVTLTINGMLAGALDDLSDVAEPTVNVFHTSVTAASMNIIFTNSNHDDPATGSVITSWGFNSPIPRVTFNPGATTLRTDNFAVRGSATVSSGTLQLNAAQELHDFTGASVLTVNSGATLNAIGSINGGSTGTLFGTVINNGTITTSGSSYLNSNTFTLSTGATLNVGFAGANQTQGWWYQSSAPSGGSLNSGSLVNYSANAIQNVAAAITYGNLALTSTVPVTKTLSGSGLAITGNLVVGSNVTFSPATQVEFTGTAAQAISGTGTLNFNGGFEVNKTSGTLTLAKALTLAADVSVTLGTLNLGDVTTTISSGADISNTGSVTSGTSGTLIISGSGTNLSGSGTVALNNLTINSVTAINNPAWSLTGNLVNNGTLTLSSTSTVTFSGGAAQSISGNAFSIGNMTVNKTAATLSVENTLELLGTLIMTNGTFDADGAGSGVFILNSDTNGDARIGAMAGGSITGNVTFERYFDNPSNRWRNLAFPVTGVTHTALQTSFPIHTNSLTYYTESTAGLVDLGWQYVNSGTLTSSRGYSAWMYNTGPITISVRGPLLKNSPSLTGSLYNFGVTYTNNVAGAPDIHDGWNFIPNPFASAINWNNAGWVKTNVNGAAAVWDIEANIYRYTDAGWDGVIAAGQAFWVQTNAASPVLTCQESVKVSTNDPIFYREAAPEDKLLIKLKSTVSEDIAAIRFRADATTEFDTQYDASKLINPIFNLSSVTRGGLSLAVNNLPKGPCASNVFLNITNIEPGSYTLKFEGLDSFHDLESAVLVDHFTNTTTTLTDKSSHVFEVSSDKASYGASRFELSFNFPQEDVVPLTISREDGVLVTNYTEATYQWFLNDVLIEAAKEASYKPTTNGNYTLEAVYKGCAMRSENITVEGMSRVYPNPVSDDLQIQVADLVPDDVTSGEIIIMSTVGSTVKQVSFSKGDLVKTIDMRDVRPGQYIVSISTKSKVFERIKLVVQ
jgi:hypothetical protein